MKIAIYKMIPSSTGPNGKFSLLRLMQQLEPVFICERYDEVLLYAGMRWLNDWEYAYDLPNEYRAQLIDEVTKHVELQNEFREEEGPLSEPESILRNRGAVRLVEELGLPVDTSEIQIEIVIPHEK
jgi:hypothetical protein